MSKKSKDKKFSGYSSTNLDGQETVPNSNLKPFKILKYLLPLLTMGSSKLNGMTIIY